MKKNKILNILAVFSLVFFASCSSLTGRGDVPKESFTKEQVKQWDKTLISSIEKNAVFPEWYGEENPIYYLRKTGKMDQKDFTFLDSLSKKKTEDISDAEVKEFTELAQKYNKDIQRNFYLGDENFKDASSFVKKLVQDSNLKINNPANHIATKVADQAEWEQIVKWSKQKDMSSKDVTNLRKLFNRFLKRNEFYNVEAWYSKEISNRVNVIANISKKETISKMERNNVNARALYVAYPEYFSKMDRWSN